MAYSDVILADSPVGYWKLDETSGTVAVDSSTNSNNGTISGTPTMGANGLVFEPSGKCIDFDGTDDVVTITPATISGSVVSFECWVSTSAVASTSVYLADGNPNRFTFAWNTTTSGQLGVYDGTSWSDFGAANNDGKGHHVVFVLDGTTAKCYVDGVQLGADQTIVAIDWSAITALALGRDYTAASNYFTGKYQKAAIYNAALTPLQIRKHYQAGIAQGFHKEVLALNPTAYFPLNEASGDAIDWSGNDNNGTLNGGVTQGTIGGLAYDDSTAYTFDGVDDGCVSDSQVADPSIITFAAKFKTTLTASGCVIGHRDSSNDLCYLYVLGTTGKVSFQFRSSGTGVQSLESISAVNDGAWHEVVAIMDKAGNHELFVDGVSNDTSTQVMSGTISSTLTTVGYMTDGTTPGGRFDGEIQCVAKFNSAPTAAQIRTLYQSGKTLIESRGYPKVIQNLNPTGYWRLGEASGTTAFDESGNGNDGAINGSPVMATADGALHQSRLKAMTFDGVDDSIRGITGLTMSATARTMNIWVNPDALPSGVSTQQLFETTDMTIVWDHTSDATLRGTGYVYSGGLFKVNFSNLSLGWQMLSLVFNGTDIRTYRNGVLQNTTAASVSIGTSVSASIGNHLTVSRSFAGNLSEASLFNSALSAQQIKQIYEAGRSRYAAEVISYEPTGYWRGNETSGTTMVDYGSGGNDGVINGAPSMGVSASPLSNETQTAVAYDGSNDYAQATTEVSDPTALTILAWGKTSSAVANKTLTSHRSGSGQELSLRMSDAGDGDMRSILDTSGETGVGLYSVDPIDDGEYHFFAVSTNKSNSYQLHVDAVLDAESSATQTGTMSSTKLTIGAIDTGSVSDYYLGDIAEVATVQAQLTPEQILDIYEMASYTSSVGPLAYKVNGSLTESLSITEWIARVHEWDTGAYLTQVLIDTSASPLYSAEVDPFSGPVSITITPNMGTVWSEAKVVVVGEYIYPTDPETNNRYYKVTTGGTTGNTEPTWPTSGTVNDNGVVFTFESSFVRPVTHGPVVPQLLP